ncbi:Exocyst complex component 5 [Quaeritorhiza haematococci]|nr:Exocyst complex component 5 [Quaeritorhiza haematococci]
MTQVLSMVIGDHVLGTQTQNLTPEQMGLPSLKTAMRLMEIHIESVNRCRELSAVGDVPRNVVTLFRLLIDIMGTRYLDASINMLLEDTHAPDGKTEPDLKHVGVVKVANQILQAIQIHFQNCILPPIAAVPTLYRDIVVYKNDFLSTLEIKLNAVLQNQIDAVLQYLSMVLSRQKKTDYRPKDENVDISNLATLPCHQCCDFLRKMYLNVSQQLDGENLEIFLTEVGSAFHGLLLEHFKKFTVSHAGGLILSKDLAKYQDTILYMKVPVLNERFEMLRELGNLFVVRPENIKGLISEGPLSRIELPLLYPYLVLRADWQKLTSLQKEIVNMAGGPLSLD